MRQLAVVILCLVQFVDVLGVTSATTAIPAILAGVGAGAALAGPLATTYAMFFGGLLVIGARLGDRVGHRAVLLVGLAGFIAVSLVGGLGGSVGQVLLARSLQGASAAVSVPAALRLLLHVAPADRERRSALAAWSAAGAAAGATGFVVGGALVEVWSWRAVFWVNAPVGAVLLIAVSIGVPAAPVEGRSVRLDVPGAAFLIAAVMGLVAGAAAVEHQGNSGLAVGLIAVGLVAGAGFARRMRTATSPLIPPEAARSRNLRQGTGLSMVNTATTSGPAVLATLCLQQVLHLSPLSAGLTLMAFSILVIVGSTVSRPLLERLSAPRVVGAGLTVIALSNLILVMVGTTWVGIGVAMGLGGLGIGVASVAATTLGTTVSDDLAGSASGILNTGAQLGTALGTAAIVSIAAVTTNRVGWAIAFAIATTAAVWALRSRTGRAA